ncbi:MAG TPA: 16S rRNA (guanine(527)-N(7))-methyltransferase RsmG [Kofleriaceae bacterium]|nr:16S rRNA (guanine(527)-N(7))-methyltransferase RsmG [Kofleriaceae bacterium]
MTDWSELLREIDLPSAGVDPDLADKYVRYLILLSKWTATTNLVATSTSPRDLVVHHLADCLALIPHLGSARRVVDVGSGGGLPGVVLAIARPAIEVTALEPVHKKHAFLATARRELALTNLHPLPERDDDHRERPDFSPYDVAVSRAVFALGDWLARGLHLVHSAGLVLAMEGRDRQVLPPRAIRHPYRLTDRDRAIIALPR